MSLLSEALLVTFYASWHGGVLLHRGRGRREREEEERKRERRKESGEGGVKEGGMYFLLSVSNLLTAFFVEKEPAEKRRGFL